jgi:glutamyl-tRNA synthetase
MAMLSVLARIGTSQPVEPVTDIGELAAGFDFSTFGRAPAHFDPHEVEILNAKLLHHFPYDWVRDRLPEEIDEEDWSIIRANIERVRDAGQWVPVLHGDIDPPELSHEERLLMKDAATIAEKLDWSDEPWKRLTTELKETSGKKGRELFHPLRLALTGRESGPEMAGLIARIGKERTVRRFEAAARR